VQPWVKSVRSLEDRLDNDFCHSLSVPSQGLRSLAEQQRRAEHPNCIQIADGAFFVSLFVMNFMSKSGWARFPGADPRLN
jgi:hypothetical protein